MSMIINFSIQNFGCFKDKQTLSFEADKSKHLEDAYVIHTHNNLRLLKVALIYGANASGKTTVLKALDFLRKLVLEPKSKKTDTLKFEPFLFNHETPQQNTVLGIEFIANDNRYFYEVEFHKSAIIREVLYVYNSKKSTVFERKTDIQHQLTDITFGKKIKVDQTTKKILEGNTLWNNTVLGGFLKTNIEIKEFKDVTDWFNLFLSPIIHHKTILDDFVSRMISNNKVRVSTIIKMLQKADLQISDIVIEKKEKQVLDEAIPFIKTIIVLSENEIEKLHKQQKIDLLDVLFEHTVNDSKYVLPIDEESQGTKRFYEFAVLLSLILTNEYGILPIDELEVSLHPDLYLHFLLTFLMNTKHSQIIATTHNRELLDNKDLFRNDAIWFTEKNKESATELYSLADFDSSVIRNTTNVLNAYKSGKLGASPNLGDYYIDFDHEENKKD